MFWRIEAWCCLPWYSDASMEAQRRYIFVVRRAKILVVRITASCGMGGERTVFLFLGLLSVLLPVQPQGGQWPQLGC